MAEYEMHFAKFGEPSEKLLARYNRLPPEFSEWERRLALCDLIGQGVVTEVSSLTPASQALYLTLRVDNPIKGAAGFHQIIVGKWLQEPVVSVGDTLIITAEQRNTGYFSVTPQVLIVFRPGETEARNGAGCILKSITDRECRVGDLSQDPFVIASGYDVSGLPAEVSEPGLDLASVLTRLSADLPRVEARMTEALEATP